MATLCQLLQEAATEFGSKTAVLIQRSYRIERWSYRYLWEFSERVATYLRGKGLRHGNCLLLWAPNMPEWFGLYFGCLRAGIILVPLDMRSTPDFVDKVREKASPIGGDKERSARGLWRTSARGPLVSKSRSA